MKIAQVAPLIESVPPTHYGGIERMVSYLTEDLIDLGHEVTLFASGDSVTSAALEVCSPRSLRLDPACPDPLPAHIAMLEQVAQAHAKFDVVHFHIDWLPLPLFRRLGVPYLTTMHSRLNSPVWQLWADKFSEAPVVAISKSQRRTLPSLNWLGTIHHGLPMHLLQPTYELGRYLAFLGRIAPEKRPDAAIRIARDAEMPLVIAAKVDKADLSYFETVVKPLLGGDVEYIGEINDSEKSTFLGGAAALLFPVEGPEPFGIVQIEAMACGVPVIAYAEGSVPEVIENGVTGFVVAEEDEAVAAIAKLPGLDRRRVRAAFEHRFTSRRMADDYLGIYRQLAKRLAVRRARRHLLAAHDGPPGVSTGKCAVSRSVMALHQDKARNVISSEKDDLRERFGEIAPLFNDL
jgi:glycosyltransferase involved in cell wall biosynthesis